MMDVKAGYDKVPSDEPLATAGEDEAELDLLELKEQNLRSLQTQRSKRFLFANSILFCGSVFLLATTYIRSTPSTAQFVSKFSSYSPARGAVQYVSGTFNATQGKDSGYIGTSNETEEMWNWVTVDMGDQMITPEELKLVNKPETSVKVKDPKTGKEGYRIGLEVFHQLHCLNLIRKSTYRDHYKGKGDFAEEDEVKIRNHLGTETLAPKFFLLCFLSCQRLVSNHC
jgi:Mycotoxin biosynthesis protein UstYa